MSQQFDWSRGNNQVIRNSFVARSEADHTITRLRSMRTIARVVNRPVFKVQSGDAGEVDGVAGEERHSPREGDGGDAEIECADSQATRLQIGELIAGGFIVGQEVHRGVLPQDALEHSIAVSDVGGLGCRREIRVPAIGLFVKTDDGDKESILGNLLQFPGEALKDRSRGLLKDRQMIGVEDVHYKSSSPGAR